MLYFCNFVQGIFKILAEYTKILTSYIYNILCNILQRILNCIHKDNHRSNINDIRVKESLKLFIVYIISFSLIFTPTVSYALEPITPDGNTNTTIDISHQNNIPVVNISAPTAGGVSHNTYTHYNVDTNGVIINNSNQIGTTQTGGNLYANPNFGTGNEEDIILNEVTSNSTSQLHGTTEIFGKQAEFILANPNGITCKGCGFINTSRLGLVTGKPTLDASGNIVNFNLSNTTQCFVKLIGDSANQLIALNASNVDYVDIISNVVEITGKVFASKELNIKTGNKEYNYSTREVTSDDANHINQVSIDAKNFGTISAGKIEIVATQKGVGVNMENGLVQSSTSDLVLTADGTLTNKAILEAKQNITMNGNNIVSEGSITAENNVSVISKESINNSGDITASNDVTITSTSIVNEGKLSATNNIDITSQGDGSVITFSNGETLKQGGSVTNQNTITAGKNVTIKSENFNNESDISANTTLDVYSTNITNTNGKFTSNDSLTIDTSNSDFTTSGIIQSKGDMNISSANLTNEIELSSEGSLVITASEDIVNNNKVQALKEMTLTSSNLVNNGQIASLEDLLFNTTNKFTNSENSSVYSGKSATINANEILNEKAEIYSVGNITLQKLAGDITDTGWKNDGIKNASIINRQGRIESKDGDINVFTEDFLNKGNVTLSPNRNWVLLFEEQHSTSDNEIDRPKIYVDKSASISGNRALLKGNNININADTFKNDASDIVSNNDIRISSNNATNVSYLEKYLFDLTYWKDGRKWVFEFTSDPVWLRNNVVSWIDSTIRSNFPVYDKTPRNDGGPLDYRHYYSNDYSHVSGSTSKIVAKASVDVQTNTFGNAEVGSEDLQVGTAQSENIDLPNSINIPTGNNGLFTANLTTVDKPQYLIEQTQTLLIKMISLEVSISYQEWAMTLMITFYLVIHFTKQGLLLMQLHKS